MRTTTLAIGVLLLTLSGGSFSGVAEEPPAKPKTKQELMKRKLELSQQLLASLTVNDLDKAAVQAKQLLLVRKDPGWKVLKTELYQSFGSEFDRSADAIIKAARDGNLESAKLSYLGMVMTCFNCHVYMRDRKTDL
jgi:hypothetical protein